MKTGIRLVDWWEEGFSPEIWILVWGSLLIAWKYADTLSLFVKVFIENFWWLPFGLWTILALGIFAWRQIRS